MCRQHRRNTLKESHNFTVQKGEVPGGDEHQLLNASRGRSPLRCRACSASLLCLLSAPMKPPWTMGSSCCEQLRLVPVALVRSRGSACRLQAVAASIRSYHDFFEGGQEPDEVTTCFFL